MNLSEKEAHCVARLLQGAMFGESVLNGCRFCKFRCEGQEDFDAIRKRLYEETGVDLRLGAENNLLYSNFPYKRFLREANEETVIYFRNFFANLT